jgi:hypothetical protein
VRDRAESDVVNIVKQKSDVLRPIGNTEVYIPYSFQKIGRKVGAAIHSVD